MITIDDIINECYIEEGIGDTIRGVGLAAGIAVSPFTYSNVPDVDKSSSENVEQEEIPIDYRSLFNYISNNEGKGKPGKPGYVYKDSKGLKTIGIGHLVTKNTSEIFKQLFGDDFDVKAVLTGETALTDDQMQKLFERDIQSKLSIIKRQLPDFMKYPQYVKNAIVDGYFRGDLSGSPTTKKLIKDGKWEEAAEEYLNFGDYKRSVQSNQQGIPHGVARRMERNRNMFLQYAKNVGDNNESKRKVTKANLDDVKKQLGDKYGDVIKYFNKKYSGQSNKSTVKSYKIKKGDTLYGISKKYNVPLKTLLANNPGIDPKSLKIGQTINI